MMDLIEATEERLTMSSPYNESIRQEFEKDPARALRDYCTVGLLLPQRSGKTSFVEFLGYGDLVVYANENELKARCVPEFPPYQVTVAHFQFRGVDTTKVRRVFVMDPFWNATGVDKMHYFKLVANTFKRPVVNVFLDSPFADVPPVTTSWE